MNRSYYFFKLIFPLIFISLNADAQVFWTETFGTDNNCANQGQFANTYVGSNGAWTVGSTGINDPEANVWFVSSTEAGMGVNNCGDGCLNNPALNNQTLHLGANDGFVFDPGAAYDAGGLCGILVCVATHTRAQSPTINCTGKVNITLAFNYMENGQAATDDMDVWYFNGAVWAILSNPAKTVNNCSGQGRWTAYSIALPASANNNALVKVGFNWKNNDDGVGTDPSTAVDDVTLSTPGGAPPVAAFTASLTSICVGQCISFTDQSTNTPTSWAWTFTGAVPNSSTAQNPTNICYNAAGVFAVSLTATNGNGSNTLTQNTYITVNALPTANAGSNVSICNGNNTTLSASGGTSYAWAPATGLSSTTISNPVASPTITTTYTVTVTNAAGCTATASVTVTVNALPTANAGSPVTICTGNNTTLTASGGTSYSWVPTSTLSCTTCASPVATPTITTTYTVFVTNAAGCSASATVVVTVQSSLTANAGSPVSICLGGSTQLNASGGSNYAWSPATGLSSTTIANPIATPTITTTYTVTVSSGTCSSTASVTITVNPNPTASAGSSVTICNGSSSPLNASGGTGYVWLPASGLSSTTISNPTANPTATTTYTVTVSNASGCTDTATVTVVVNPLPTVSAGSNVTICNGGNTQLTATGGTSYVWAPSGSLSSSTGNTVTATPTITTTYTITITDANGCSDTAQVTVTVTPCSGPIPIIQASATTVCEGTCITFNDASTNSPTSWTWTFPSGTPSSSLQQNPGTVCFSPAGTYTVSLTVSNVNGTNTTTQVITVNPMPVAVAGTSTTISTGNSVTLSSSGGGTYSWAPASSLSCVTCANPIATPTVTTTYTCFVTLGGCTDTAQVIIDVIDSANIFIPNASSPNNDGENDFFFVHGAGIKSIQIVVYDRIGEKVFETADINIGWDGTYKGQKMNTAVFVYYVTVFYFNGKDDTLHGDLSLIR